MLIVQNGPWTSSHTYNSHTSKEGHKAKERSKDIYVNYLLQQSTEDSYIHFHLHIIGQFVTLNSKGTLRNVSRHPCVHLKIKGE